MIFLLYIIIDKYLTFLIFICEYLYEYLFLKNYWNLTISIKNGYLNRFSKYVFFIVFFICNNILSLLLIYSYLYAGFFLILVSIKYLNKHLFVKWFKKCFFLFIFLYFIGWLSLILYVNWLFIYKFYKFYKSEYNCWRIKTVNEEISFFFNIINIFIYKKIIVTYFKNCIILKKDYGISDKIIPNKQDIFYNKKNILFSFFLLIFILLLFVSHSKWGYFQIFNFDIISFFLSKYFIIDNDPSLANIPHQLILWNVYIKKYIVQLIYNLFLFFKNNKWAFKLFYFFLH